MTFLNKFDTEISLCDKSLIRIRLDDNIYLDQYNNDVLVSTYKIASGLYSYSKVWFSKINNSSICAIITEKDNSLNYIYINLQSKFLIRKEILSHRLNSIEFPYISYKNNYINILYLINNVNKSTEYQLVHYFRFKKKWTKNIACTSIYTLLTNYVVIEEKEKIDLFYLKGDEYYEELYYRYFNFSSAAWSEPQKLTDNKKHKVYLAAVKDKRGNFHVSYSESNDRIYNIKYLYLSSMNDYVYIKKYSTVPKTIAPMFPNILLRGSDVYIEWIEYNLLYYMKINDDNFYAGIPVLIKKSTEDVFYGCIGDNDKNFVSFINKNGEKI